MATKPIAEIAPADRRWLSEEEAIGYLNITRPEWERFIKPKAYLYVGKNYDRDQLNRLMEKNVVIKKIL